MIIYLRKIKTENIIDHLFKNDQYLDKLKSQDTNFITKIKIEYDRLLEKDIFKNLEETKIALKKSSKNFS